MKTYYFILSIVLFIIKLEAQTWENIDMTFPQGDSLLSASQITFATKNIGWIFTEESYITGGRASKIYKTKDGGHNWFLQYNGDYFLNTSPFSLDSMHCWAVDFYGNLVFTKDGGEEWDTLKIAEGSTNNQFCQIRFFNENDGIIISFKQPWFSTDGGKTWNSGDTASVQLTAAEITFANKNTGWLTSYMNPYATDCGYISKTTDGGKSWQFQDHYYPDSTGVMTPIMSGLYFSDSLSGFALGNNVKFSNPYILSTTDGGENWKRKQFINAGVFYDINFYDNKYGWITGGGSIWETTDGGINWSLQSTGINSRLGKLIIFPEEKAAYIWGDNHYTSPYVLLYADLNSLTNTLEPVNEINTQCFLNQNYPNPFNPTTIFNFGVAKEAHTTLKIYNILGEKVATLVNKYTKPGTYTINWNADGFPSGIYIAIFESGSFIKAQKLIFLK